MAYIILPSRRTRQPQGAVRINTFSENSGAQFVVCGPYAASRARQFVGPTASSDSGIGVTPDGIGYKFGGGAGEYARFDTNFLLAASSACSIEFIVYGSSFPSLAHLFGLAGTADTTGGITDINGATRSILSFNGGPPCNIYGWGGANDSDSGAQFQTGVKQHIVAVKPTGTDVCDWVFYRNGKYLATAPSSSGNAYLNTGPYFYLGARHPSGSSTITGTIPLAVFHDKVLSAAEVTERYLNPWGVVVNDVRRLYFDTGAATGGSIFESTFANTLSLADTYAALANYVSTYADSPTVTDSSSTSVIYTSAFAETIPVSDGPSADMGGVANRTQEESFTITDAYSASMVATATISETLSAEASASTSAIFNASFAETLPIVDGEEADAGRISDIAENVTVTDAYTAGIVAQATQAESVTTIDTYDTIAIYNPTLEETLPITDAVGATLTVPTSGTVDLSQESIDALALEIMNQLTSVPVRRL